MEALQQLEPWHIAALAGLVALLACGLAVWVVWRVSRDARRLQQDVSATLRTSRDHLHLFRWFLVENGYKDNFTKTKAFSESDLRFEWPKK